MNSNNKSIGTSSPATPATPATPPSTPPHLHTNSDLGGEVGEKAAFVSNRKHKSRNHKPKPNFREAHKLVHRKREASKLREQWPSRIPVVVETDTKLLPLDKYKYLVPKDLTMAQFAATVRRRAPKLDDTKAVFMFVNKNLVCGISTFEVLDEEHRDPDDGFLYIQVNLENTFGRLP